MRTDNELYIIIFDLISSILNNFLVVGECPPNNYNLDANLYSQLHFDNLAIIELVITLESKLNIEISDEELETFETVKDIVEVCQNKLSRITTT